MTRFVPRFIAQCLVLLCTGAFAFGQTDRATITGTLSDSTGAIIPGARVLVTNSDTGTIYSGAANNSGIYTIPGLPVGTYSVKIDQTGFREYVQTDIILIAAQVLQLNVRMTVGSTAETIAVSGDVVPLLETETSSTQMTIEQSALRDLPLDATGGRDAMSLALATTPLVSTAAGGQSTNLGTWNWNIFAGNPSQSNSVYIDGVESTTGSQGNIATPGLDALSEVQLVTSPNDAEFGPGSGVEMFQIKSGTNKFHGSAFEFLQNEALNANKWDNNYYKAQCAPGDSSCVAANGRGFDRFNDYGASAGGPIWKKHTFVFGDFEIYRYKDFQLEPNSVTVPTPQMLSGDFSQLLTGGAQQGDIPGPNGGPWINPCTGQPYQYGQIFDPETQQVVNGTTCATPFPGNVIPSGRLSNVSKQLAAEYAKHYSPTISTRIYNNFPEMVAGVFSAGNPINNKFTLDLKVDHNFSEKHHLSAGLNHVSWRQIWPAGPGVNNPNLGPFQNDVDAWLPNVAYRVIDNYSFSPTLLNTFAVGFGEQKSSYSPNGTESPSTFGIPGPASKLFPAISYSGPSNGIEEPIIGCRLIGYYNTNAFQYQDTIQWTRGRHSLKFGGTMKFQQMNTATGFNQQYMQFNNDTGGPTDPGLTPYVGFHFASQMLGDVTSNSITTPVSAYPRQTEIALFTQDDFKVSSKLTLNLGLRWDFNGRDHEKYGHLSNFDITVQNPNWAPYNGAWVFSKNSGTTFETNQAPLQFGPHIGGAYRIGNKLVARGSYGVFYVPDNLIASTWPGAYPEDQTEMSFPSNQVLNNVPGSIGYNWDQGYPGQDVLPVQNSTTTTLIGGTIPFYTHPDNLKLGYTHNWYAGFEYAITSRMSVDTALVGNRGRNIHDPARSLHRNSPDWNVYQPLLASGNLTAQVSDPSSAAAAGVPYPYAGFNGPAYAAIAPYPQLSSVGMSLQIAGDPADAAQDSYNAFVAEVKARDYHGVYLNFSYTLSKMVGSFQGLQNTQNNWADFAQNYSEWQDEKHWVQYLDQRHLLKGYATYLLPFGKGKKFAPGVSAPLDAFIGGWELGYYGAYGSGLPMALLFSPYQLVGYYGFNRVNFAPGLTARDMRHHFHGHADLANVTDPVNSDFSPSEFTPTTPSAPFGNTPFTFNHWRWNSQPAQENISILKHFKAGERATFTLGAEFFDVFNRHYWGAPGTAMGTPNFGQVTSVSGYRYGQLRGRIEW